MRIAETRTITIVGAGLAGSLLAVMLARRGFKVDLFERNPDPRGDQPAAGRSINLAIGERGRHALDPVGLLQAVNAFTIPTRGRMLHDIDGNQRLQPYGKDESEVIFSAHRTRLNSLLLDTAEDSENVRLFFNHHLESLDRRERQMLFRNPCDGTDHEHGYQVLIGADGGGSAVRRALSLYRRRRWTWWPVRPPAPWLASSSPDRRPAPAPGKNPNRARRQSPRVIPRVSTNHRPGTARPPAHSAADSPVRQHPARRGPPRRTPGCRRRY